MRYFKTFRDITVEPSFIMASIVFISHYFSLPQLLIAKICLRNYDEEICSSLSDYDDIQNKIQAESALWIMIIGLSAALPSVLIVLIIGPISDIFGRKIFFNAAPILLGLHSISLFLNSYFMDLHMWYLVPAFLFPTFLGNFQGIILLAYAYIAQVTSSGKQRTMRMGVIGGSLTLSIAAAGLISGFIIDNHGYPSLYVVTLAFCVANFAYTTLFLPRETEYLDSYEPCLQEEMETNISSKVSCMLENSEDNALANKDKSIDNDKERKPEKFVLPNPLTCIKASISFFLEGKNRNLRLLLLTAFGFTILAILGEVNIIILFLKRAPFNFSALKVGSFLAGSQVIRGLGSVLIPQIVLRACPVTDFALAGFGFLSKIATDIWIAFSVDEKMLIISLFIGVGGALPTICLRAAISKTVRDKKFGTLLCTLAAINEIFILISDILSTNVYRFTVGWFPGFQFLISAAFCLIGLAIVSYLYLQDLMLVNGRREPLLKTDIDEIR